MTIKEEILLREDFAEFAIVHTLEWLRKEITGLQTYFLFKDDPERYLSREDVLKVIEKGIRTAKGGE